MVLPTKRAPNSTQFPPLLGGSLQEWGNHCQQGCVLPASPPLPTPACVFPASILHWLTELVRSSPRAKIGSVSFSCWKGVSAPGNCHLQQALEQVGAHMNVEWIRGTTFAGCKLLPWLGPLRHRSSVTSFFKTMGGGVLLSRPTVVSLIHAASPFMPCSSVPNAFVC